MKTGKRIYANIESLDYYQGYFDCLKNITQNAAKYDPEMDTIYTDARFQEMKMFENLKNKYGDSFSIDAKERGYIEGGDDEN